jgi:hypothetical protein
MPLHYADLEVYILAAALPVLLLALFGLFRWRYLQVVEQAISADVRGPDADSSAPAQEIPYRPLVLVKERLTEGKVHAGPELRVAQREEAAYRSAFVVSGLVFVALAALLIWWGQKPVGNRAAVSIAYSCTLPAIVLVLAFASRGWRAAIAWTIVWLSVGFVVHLFLGISGSDQLGLIPGAIGFIGPPTLTVGLLAHRATRPVLVGLVPIVFVWLVMSMAAAAALAAVGISLDGGFTSRAIVAGLAAAALGIGLAVRLIRRHLSSGSVLLLVGLTVGGVLVGRFESFGLGSAIVTGIGTNGLVTVAIWWLFARFVRFKANGHLPDEVLHYSFGWLGLTVYLPNFAVALAWPWSLLPLIGFGVTFERVLISLRGRVRARVPRRLLFLRPFSNGRLRSDLLDALDASWRRVGTVDLVVGGDLAVRTISGPVLESVLLGTVHRHFLGRLDDVNDRLGRLPRRAALDGRFPLNEVHCDPDVWRTVVTALADQADVVLMDLRALRSRNQGALFELRMAIQRVELARIVLLADPSTDECELVEVVEKAWQARSDTYPDRDDPNPRLVVLQCSGHVARDNAWIVEKVFAAGERGPRRLSRGSL